MYAVTNSIQLYRPWKRRTEAFAGRVMIHRQMAAHRKSSSPKSVHNHELTHKLMAYFRDDVTRDGQTSDRGVATGDRYIYPPPQKKNQSTLQNFIWLLVVFFSLSSCFFYLLTHHNFTPPPKWNSWLRPWQQTVVLRLLLYTRPARYLNIRATSQYPVARSHSCSWHPSASLVTRSQYLSVHLHNRHMGQPAYTSLSRCSAMDARPHAA